MVLAARGSQSQKSIILTIIIIREEGMELNHILRRSSTRAPTMRGVSVSTISVPTISSPTTMTSPSDGRLLDNNFFVMGLVNKQCDEGRPEEENDLHNSERK